MTIVLCMRIKHLHCVKGLELESWLNIFMCASPLQIDFLFLKVFDFLHFTSIDQALSKHHQYHRKYKYELQPEILR